ncbi:MAG: GNAT family N-acetyltransferase [Proteobacteria bacterium]|nr:GNAT family N-acetyltransferase [Pseudomonadota bacterium]
MDSIKFRHEKKLPEDQVIALYSALDWSSSSKPRELLNALANSHSVISAWDDDTLIGLGNSISDGYLVVYYPHLLVLPDYQGKGIGKEILSKLKNIYSEFHQQILVADGNAVGFFKSCGFVQAGSCEPLWIYNSGDQE